MFEQGDVSVGSPRALYGHRGAATCLYHSTPIPESLGAQFDNAGTLGGCFGRITFPEAD